MKFFTVLKKSLVFTLLAGCITTYAAQKSEPALATQNGSTPLFPDWLQTLSQDMAEVCNLEGCSSLEKEALVAKAIQETFFDLIITDSTKAHDYRNKVYKAFQEHLSPTMSLQKINLLADEYEKKCPLLLFKECDGPTCVLSRCYNPACKEEFESEAVEVMSKKLTTNGHKPLQYVGFGSGDMLLDCFLLTKLLHAQTVQKKPRSNLVLHFVDPYYRFYVGLRDAYTGHRKVDTSYSIPTIFAAHFPGSADEKRTELIRMEFWHERKFKQLLSFLQTRFKEATFSLYIHDSTASYLTYIAKHKIPAADIVVAADIHDSKDVDANSIKDFTALVIASRQTNPSASFIVLEKGREINADGKRVDKYRITKQILA